MLYPTINELTHDEYKRYELALATAKCARLITDEYVKQRTAAETALTVEVADMAAVYRKRREYVLERLDRMGLGYPKPEGAFYVFPDIAKFGMDSESFCIRLIQDGGLAAVPGSCFGCEGHIRLSYCYSDEELKESLDRLEQFIRSL